MTRRATGRLTRRLTRRAAWRAGAAGLLAAGACKSEPVAAAAATNEVLPDSAEQVMYKLRHYLTNAGVRRAYLVADTAYFYDDGNRVELRTVRLVFFGAAGDSSSVLTSRRGRLESRQRRVEGRGNVVVTTVEGKRLTSPQLAYDQFTNQITSDSSFVFTEPGRTLSGVGLRTDPQLRNVQVLGQLGGRTRVNADALSRPGAGATPAPPGAAAPTPPAVPAAVPPGGTRPTTAPPAASAPAAAPPAAGASPAPVAPPAGAAAAQPRPRR